MDERLQRIQFVTRYYDWLQGLRFLPFGVLLAGFALWLALLPPDGGTPAAVGAIALAVGMVATLVLYPLAGGYYQRRFGEVRPSAVMKQTRLRLTVLFAVVGLALASGLVALGFDGAGTGFPVSGALAVSAAALLAYWAAIGRFVPHYPPIAGAMLLVAALHALGLNPLCGWLHAGDAASTIRCDLVTFHAAWGVALTALAVLDHRLLVQALSPAPADAAELGAAG
ncbi:hypothetical protein [Corallococcus macrosporus]|uniref:Uncharacterized protein n=1 Tax=Myxococcus fulvus (strain ATCC BAA-855 / HW-1) TaxID=483219 RepID=F8CF49_MYXFH|nr:hypothetical protein [Corallococcus macrosporus]AEI68637.1 hypothetical protein LILAB_33780 [Corallococcus macrosporus]